MKNKQSKKKHKQQTNKLTKKKIEKNKSTTMGQRVK
jgi:hypothetical protein